MIGGKWCVQAVKAMDVAAGGRPNDGVEAGRAGYRSLSTMCSLVKGCAVAHLFRNIHFPEDDRCHLMGFVNRAMRKQVSPECVTYPYMNTKSMC